MPGTGTAAQREPGLLLETRSHDIEDHAAALPGWEQRYSRLTAGPFEGRLWHVRGDGVSLFRENTNVAIREEVVAPTGTVVVGLPLEGSAPSVFHGKPLGRGDMLALSGDLPSEFLCRGRMDVFAAVFEPGALRAGGLPVPEPTNGRFATVIKAGGGAALRAWMLAALAAIDEGRPRDGETAPPALPLHVVLDGVCALGKALAGEPTTRPPMTASRCHRIAAAARSYVDANAERPISVPELARAAGASVRGLELSFSEAIGVSPAAYLRIVRLNGAHRMLRDATSQDLTVAEVATAWGFWHLSRFSAYYQSLFGVPPSATLRAGRGGH